MRNDNSIYWENKQEKAEKAVKHTKIMEELHGEEIEKCIAGSQIYSEAVNLAFPENGNIPRIIMAKVDTVSAILRYTDDKTAVLNFASYKNPGGMFLQGSKAQEECLCHESFLYNVLSAFNDTYYSWNRKNLNKALYLNRAIYSPDVLFERIEAAENNEGKPVNVHCDVITCAAPNITAAAKVCGVDATENEKALESRIRFILDIAEANKVETLILGAFGCGVFGQNPEMVGHYFSSFLHSRRYRFKKVIFAVIPGNENYDKLKEGLSSI